MTAYVTCSLIVGVLIDVEIAQLVRCLAGRDDAEEIADLLLLESIKKHLRPMAVAGHQTDIANRKCDGNTCSGQTE